MAGFVYDGEGNPVAGAKVTVKRQHSPSVPVVVNVAATVLSESDGSFFIPDVRSGEAGFVEGSHPEFLDSQSDMFDIGSGEEIRDLALTMHVGGAVSGIVVDADTGAGAVDGTDGGKLAARLAALAMLADADATPALTILDQLALDVADGALGRRTARLS